METDGPTFERSGFYTGGLPEQVGTTVYTGPGDPSPPCRPDCQSAVERALEETYAAGDDAVANVNGQCAW